MSEEEIPKEEKESKSEVTSLNEQLKEFKDKYLRALAESENTRKRLQKDSLEAVQYATEDLITSFLQPIDNLENALKFASQMSPEVKNWAIGFEMILNQFKEVLTSYGVTSTPSVGTLFNPHEHEAIESIESDKMPGTILEESLKGYKMGNRIIRPAKVKVAKKEEKKEENKEAL